MFVIFAGFRSNADVACFEVLGCAFTPFLSPETSAIASVLGL